MSIADAPCGISHQLGERRAAEKALRSVDAASHRSRARDRCRTPHLGQEAPRVELFVPARQGLCIACHQLPRAWTASTSDVARARGREDARGGQLAIRARSPIPRIATHRSIHLLSGASHALRAWNHQMRVAWGIGDRCANRELARRAHPRALELRAQVGGRRGFPTRGKLVARDGNSPCRAAEELERRGGLLGQVGSAAAICRARRGRWLAASTDLARLLGGALFSSWVANPQARFGDRTSRRSRCLS